MVEKIESELRELRREIRELKTTILGVNDHLSEKHKETMEILSYNLEKVLHRQKYITQGEVLSLVD